MTTFSRIWNKEVKPLAQACLVEPEFIRLMSKDDDYEETLEEKEYLKTVEKKYKDVHSMYYISKMISTVDHAIEIGNKDEAWSAVAHVYEVLNRPSYFEYFFKDDPSCQEWKSLKALKNGLSKLV